ncbi:hypothetical protein RUND412_004437 [Rhizina undulata]
MCIFIIRAISEKIRTQLNRIPRAGQLEAIRFLLEGKDVMLSAPTGWGKSLILQSLAILHPNKVITVVSPLSALQSEQVEELNSLGVKACPVTQNTVSARLISMASAGHFRLEFNLGPEMALSRVLRVMWDSLSTKISIIAVNEVHVVHEWGNNFRKEYSRLGNLRY